MNGNHLATLNMTSGRVGKHSMKQAREDANNAVRALGGLGEGIHLTADCDVCSKGSTVGICR